MSDSNHLDENDQTLINGNFDIVSHANKILDEETRNKKPKRRSAKSYFDILKKPDPVKEKPKQKKKTKLKTKTKRKPVISDGSKEAVRKTKTSLKPAKPPVFIDADQLPAKYEKTEVTLIARDPFWVYAYWEVEESAISKLRNQIGEKIDQGTYTLRMFDVTYIDFNGYNAHYWYDLDDLYMNNRYIQLSKDGASFLAEIGIRTDDGDFYPLARSNTVSTPRANISNRCDLIWHEVEENKKSCTFIMADINVVKNRPPLFPRNNWQHHIKQITLSARDILNYYSKEVLLSKYLLSKHIKNKIVNEEGPAEEVHISTEKSFNPVLMGQYRKTTKYIGASDSLVVTEEGASGAGFESIQEKRESFYFEIDTKLTVTGRTEPDASVYLGNKQVELEDDGTFTLHYDLPDGIIPLEFTAKSNKNVQQRKIITSVQRNKTQYSKFI